MAIEDRPGYNSLTYDEQFATYVLQTYFLRHHTRMAQSKLKIMLKDMKEHPVFYEFNKIVIDVLAKKSYYKKLVDAVKLTPKPEPKKRIKIKIKK